MLIDIFNRVATPLRGESKPRLVFLHLPRTGGTALVKDILFPNFPRPRCCHVNYSQDLSPLAGAHDPLRWSESKRGRVRLLAGHMPFGIAQHFRGVSEYVTLLRDPIVRTVSDYHFCRMNPTNPAYEAARELSLVDFVERGFGLTHNCYARWLSNATFGTVFPGDGEMLNAARKNLATFALVGITEAFDLTVLRICVRYGLTPHPFSSCNRNDATPHGNAISGEERRAISRHNELDLILYEEYRERFSREPGQENSARAETDTLKRTAHT